MKHFTFILGMLSILSVATLAGAHSPSPNGSCANVGDDTLTLAGLVTLVIEVPTGETFYVATDPEASVWTESNDWPGLQTHEHTCRIGGTGSNPTYLTIPADTRVTVV